MDEKGYNLALRYLARRPRSEKEVRDHLLKKKVSQTDIDAILTKLRDQKFVDDMEFARWWIDQRTRFKVKGWPAIKFELKQKGISAEALDELGSRNYELGHQEEKEKIKILIEKRKSKYEGLSRQELYVKLGGFLGRRGFSWVDIRAAIDEVFKN